MFGGGFPFSFKMGGGGMGGDDNDGPGISEEDTPTKDVDNKKLYDVLGVAQNAGTDEIKKAYLKLAKVHHPDKGGDKEKFAEIQEANEILTDPEKRQLYDKWGMEGVKNGGPSGGFDDIFSAFMGGGMRGPQRGGKQQRKGKPVLRELEVTLEDVYTGKSVKLGLSKHILCETCQGKGGSNIKVCGPCKGRGMVEKIVSLGPGMYSHSTGPCHECRGQGKTIEEKDKCKDCKGEKVKKVTKQIDVTIEPGVPNEKDIILTGEGDELPGIMPGDVVVRVLIKPHPRFQRKGADLYMEKNISLLEAITGFHQEIEHLDGRKFTVSTVPGEVISANETKCIKKKGLPFYRDQMSHGNLYIKFKIDFPKKGELKPDTLEGLKKLLPGGPNIQPLDKSKPYEFLEEFHEDETNPNPEGGRNKGEEDEEDGMPQGGQRVQCAQQ